MDPEEYEKIFGYLSDKRYPNDIKGKFIVQLFWYVKDDIDNDDVIEAKSPVCKSKWDKPTQRQSFIYDYDKI